MSKVVLAKQAVAPATPDTGKAVLYVDPDTVVRVKDDAGNVYALVRMDALNEGDLSLTGKVTAPEVQGGTDSGTLALRGPDGVVVEDGLDIYGSLVARSQDINLAAGVFLGAAGQVTPIVQIHPQNTAPVIQAGAWTEWQLRPGNVNTGQKWRIDIVSPTVSININQYIELVVLFYSATSQRWAVVVRDEQYRLVSSVPSNIIVNTRLSSLDSVTFDVSNITGGRRYEFTPAADMTGNRTSAYIRTLNPFGTILTSTVLTA